MTNPLVSVLMPVYNGESYLRESVDSIFKQTFTDFEYIIIDDGSTDQTWEILTEYATVEPRIRLFKNEKNLGITPTLNKGLNLAKGEYIARQDADDISLPERLAKQVYFLEKHPDFVLVSSEIDTIDAQGTSLRKSKSLRHRKPILICWSLLFYNCIGGHSQVMYRSKSICELGGYSPEYIHCEDYELWSRMSKIGKIYILPEVLLKYRLHPSSISRTVTKIQDEQILKVVKRNLEQLLDRQLAMTEVADLNKFASQNRSLTEIDFLKKERIASIQQNLQLIYRYFLKSNQFEPENQAEVAAHLRLLICNNFLCWAESLKNNPPARLNILRYAFIWDYKVLLRILTTKIKNLLSLEAVNL